MIASRLAEVRRAIAQREHVLKELRREEAMLIVKRVHCTLCGALRGILCHKPSGGPCRPHRERRRDA